MRHAKAAPELADFSSPGTRMYSRTGAIAARQPCSTTLSTMLRLALLLTLHPAVALADLTGPARVSGANRFDGRIHAEDGIQASSEKPRFLRPTRFSGGTDFPHGS